MAYQIAELTKNAETRVVAQTVTPLTDFEGRRGLVVITRYQPIEPADNKVTWHYSAGMAWKSGPPAYFTNGKVAWECRDAGIAGAYEYGLYRCPPGWAMLRDRPAGEVGECKEIRLEA